MVYAIDKWFTLTWNELKRKTQVIQSIGKWFNVIWNGRLIESNHKWPSETRNGLKGTQMLQSTKKRLDLIWNYCLCKGKMVFPNAKWRREKTNGLWQQQMLCVTSNTSPNRQKYKINVKWNNHRDFFRTTCQWMSSLMASWILDVDPWWQNVTLRMLIVLYLSTLRILFFSERVGKIISSFIWPCLLVCAWLLSYLWP